MSISANNDSHPRGCFVMGKTYSDHFWSLKKEDIKRLVYAKGDMINFIDGSDTFIQPTSPHFKRALNKLSEFIIPNNMEEFLEIYSMIEWDWVCTHLYLAVRLSIMEPNPWQNLIMGLWLWEYDPEICPECGLNRGDWCCPCELVSDYYFSSFLLNYEFIVPGWNEANVMDVHAGNDSEEDSDEDGDWDPMDEDTDEEFEEVAPSWLESDYIDNATASIW